MPSDSGFYSKYQQCYGNNITSCFSITWFSHISRWSKNPITEFGFCSWSALFYGILSLLWMLLQFQVSNWAREPKYAVKYQMALCSFNMFFSLRGCQGHFKTSPLGLVASSPLICFFLCSVLRSVSAHKWSQMLKVELSLGDSRRISWTPETCRLLWSNPVMQLQIWYSRAEYMIKIRKADKEVKRKKEPWTRSYPALELHNALKTTVSLPLVQ